MRLMRRVIHCSLALCFILNSVPLEAEVTQQQLESIASRLHNSKDPDLAELTDAVLSYPSEFKLPSVIKPLIASKLQNAELEYWRDERPGVTELDVANAVNGLCDALKLPAEATTTASQVHAIRIKLLVTYPQLMGLHIGTKDMSGRFHMSTKISTLQAVHLLLTIFELKVPLPEYQVTPSAWEASRERAPSVSETSAASVVSSAVRTNNTEETHKIYRALWDAKARMSESDGLALVFRTMRYLGAD